MPELMGQNKVQDQLSLKLSWGWETAQHIRAHNTLAEDLRSLPSNQVGWFTNPYNSIFRRCGTRDVLASTSTCKTLKVK